MSVSTLPSRPDLRDEDDKRSDSGRSTTAAAGALRDGDAFNAHRIAGLLILSLLPFWAVPLAHVVSDPDTATGFFHYELPYYVANGRAAFARGNGVCYPNPYDPSPESPAIYAHWLPWVFGLLTAKAGCDPGDVILAFTFFAALAFAWATRQQVLLRIGSAGSPDIAFLAAMWGGGLLCAAGALCSHGGTTPWSEALLQFDPGRGMWFLNWGRNALFPTEALYHTLVACCWVAEIRRQSAIANVCLLLLATTHPWSGLELLLTMNLWRGVQYLRQRDASTRHQMSAAVVMLVAFLGYYKVWLPTFPQHARLQSVWELNWSLTWTAAALAYLPVLIPCCVLLRRRLRSMSADRCEQFLLCALVVAAGLAFHDRLIRPVQPLHFTRGYVWLPVFLLGLPVLLEWWAAARRRSAAAGLAAILLAGVFVADNFVFAAVHCQRQFTGQDGFHLNADERALLAALHQRSAATPQIVLTDSETVNYLLPTYSHARPWLGHHFNTPDFPERRETWQRCFTDHGVATDEIPADVDLIAIRRSRPASGLRQDLRWSQQADNNGGWLTWERRRESTD